MVQFTESTSSFFFASFFACSLLFFKTFSHLTHDNEFSCIHRDRFGYYHHGGCIANDNNGKKYVGSIRCIWNQPTENEKWFINCFIEIVDSIHWIAFSPFFLHVVNDYVSVSVIFMILFVQEHFFHDDIEKFWEEHFPLCCWARFQFPIEKFDFTIFPFRFVLDRDLFSSSITFPSFLVLTASDRW